MFTEVIKTRCESPGQTLISLIFPHYFRRMDRMHIGQQSSSSNNKLPPGGVGCGIGRGRGRGRGRKPNGASEQGGPPGYARPGGMKGETALVAALVNSESREGGDGGNGKEEEEEENNDDNNDDNNKENDSKDNNDSDKDNKEESRGGGSGCGSGVGSGGDEEVTASVPALVAKHGKDAGEGGGESAKEKGDMVLPVNYTKEGEENNDYNNDDNNKENDSKDNNDSNNDNKEESRGGGSGCSSGVGSGGDKEMTALAPALVAKHGKLCGAYDNVDTDHALEGAGSSVGSGDVPSDDQRDEDYFTTVQHTFKLLEEASSSCTGEVIKGKMIISKDGVEKGFLSFKGDLIDKVVLEGVQWKDKKDALEERIVVCIY